MKIGLKNFAFLVIIIFLELTFPFDAPAKSATRKSTDVGSHPGEANINPGEAIEWDAVVLWNGASLTFGTPCDASATYNMPVNSIKTYIDSVTDSASLINEDGLNNALGIDFEINSGFLGNVTVNDLADSKFQTYYMGVAGNRKYLRFVNGSTLIKCDGTSSCEASTKLNLGLSAGELQDKKAIVVFRGFESDPTGSYDSSAIKMAYYKIEVDLDSSDVSDNEVEVRAQSLFYGGEADYPNRQSDVTVYHTVILYDPSVIALEHFSVDDMDSNSLHSHSFEADKPVNVATSGTVLPDDFDTSESVSGFVGLTNWGFEQTASPTEIRRLKARAKIDKWDRTSNTTGTATVEVVGAASRYACGLKTDYDVKPELAGWVILCKSAAVCKATFDDTSESTSETLAEDVYIKNLRRW